MYLLSILLFMALCVGYSVLSTSGGIGSIIHYIDPASLVVMVLIVLPVLMSSGLFHDFNNAFKFSTIRQKPCSRTALLRAIEAVNLVIKALWASGVFNSVFTIIQLLATADGMDYLAKALSVSLITLLYAAFLVILLLPLKSRLLVRLHELDAEQPAEPDTKVF